MLKKKLFIGLLAGAMVTSLVAPSTAYAFEVPFRDVNGEYTTVEYEGFEFGDEYTRDRNGWGTNTAMFEKTLNLIWEATGKPEEMNSLFVNKETGQNLMLPSVFTNIKSIKISKTFEEDITKERRVKKYDNGKTETTKDKWVGSESNQYTNSYKDSLYPGYYNIGYFVEGWVGTDVKVEVSDKEVVDVMIVEADPSKTTSKDNVFIKPLKVGKATVTLTYTRDWGNYEPYVFSFDVEVVKDSWEELYDVVKQEKEEVFKFKNGELVPYTEEGYTETIYRTKSIEFEYYDETLEVPTARFISAEDKTKDLPETYAMLEDVYKQIRGGGLTINEALYKTIDNYAVNGYVAKVIKGQQYMDVEDFLGLDTYNCDGQTKIYNYILEQFGIPYARYMIPNHVYSVSIENGLVIANDNSPMYFGIEYSKSKGEFRMYQRNIAFKDSLYENK